MKPCTDGLTMYCVLGWQSMLIETSVWTPMFVPLGSCLCPMWGDGGFSATADVPALSQEEAGRDSATAGLAFQFLSSFWSPACHSFQIPSSMDADDDGHANRASPSHHKKAWQKGGSEGFRIKGK